jgi:hypothetical protein
MKCCQANLIQDAAFEKAKESVRGQASLLLLPAPSQQGVRTSTKRKSLEVEEEVDPAVSPKGAKPSGKKLIKTAAKKSAAKKAKVVEAVPDSSIIDVDPLDEDHDDTATLSSLTRKVEVQKRLLSDIIEAQKALEVEDRAIAQKYKEAKKLAKLAAAAFQAKAQTEDAKKLAVAFQAKSEAEGAERKHLKVEEEKKRQADKAEEERIAEIARKLEMKKKEKAQADQKRQQEFERNKREEEKKRQEEERKKEETNAAKKKIGQVVPREAKLTKLTVVAPVVSMQQAVQSAVEVRPSIEAVTSSIEVAAPLVSMLFALIFCSSCALITNLTFLL